MKQVILVVGILLLGTGCSATKVKVDQAGLAQAKKVAVVGFHLQVQEPKSIVGDFNKLSDAVHGKVEDANPESNAADEIYLDLTQKLASEMNWDVKPLNEVRGNLAYKELEKEFTTGLQLRGMKAENMKTLRPHGIIDAEPFQAKISQERREKLMDALGVNTLVADFVLATLNNESTFGGMVGRAKYKPKTQNIIRVYVRGKKDPVWFDTWAWGEGDQAIQATANYIADEDLLKQVRVSSRKSFAETFKRYKAL